MSATPWIQEPDSGRFYYLSRGRDGRTVRRYEDESAPASSSTSRPPPPEPYQKTPRSETSRSSKQTTAFVTRQPKSSSSGRRASESSTRRPESITEVQRDGRTKPLAVAESTTRYHKSGGYDEQWEERGYDRSGKYISSRDSRSIPPSETRNERSARHKYDEQSAKDSLQSPTANSLSRGMEDLTMEEVVGSPQYTSVPPASAHHEQWPPTSSPPLVRSGVVYDDQPCRDQWMGNEDNLQDSSSRPIHHDEGKGKGVAQDSINDFQQTTPYDPRYVAATEGHAEKLDKSYQVRNLDYKKFFRVGRVFSTLWTDPYASNTNTQDQTFQSSVTYVIYKERVHTKIRRFVVVRQLDRRCICLPVTSYDGRGHKKTGIDLTEHGQIYSHKRPREVRGISKEPLRVILSRGAAKLEDPSLINYRRVYTVETNVKVKDVGEVDSESLRLLRRYFKNAMADPDDSDGLPRGDFGTQSTRRKEADLVGIGSGLSQGFQGGYLGPSGSSGGNDHVGSSHYHSNQGHQTHPSSWTNPTGLPYQGQGMYPPAPPPDSSSISPSIYYPPLINTGPTVASSPDLGHLSPYTQYQQAGHRVSHDQNISSSRMHPLPPYSPDFGARSPNPTTHSYGSYVPTSVNLHPAGTFHTSISNQQHEQSYLDNPTQNFVPPVVGNTRQTPSLAPINDPSQFSGSTPVDRQSPWPQSQPVQPHREVLYEETEDIVLPSTDEIRASRRRDSVSTTGRSQAGRRDRERDRDRDRDRDRGGDSHREYERDRGWERDRERDRRSGW